MLDTLPMKGNSPWITCSYMYDMYISLEMINHLRCYKSTKQLLILEAKPGSFPALILWSYEPPGSSQNSTGSFQVCFGWCLVFGCGLSFDRIDACMKRLHWLDGGPCSDGFSLQKGTGESWPFCCVFQVCKRFFSHIIFEVTRLGLHQNDNGNNWITAKCKPWIRTQKCPK